MVVVSDTTLLPGLGPEVDELAARGTLRTQIARLERELADAVAAGFPFADVPHRLVRRPGPQGPRLLGLGELELLRDDLADRLREARVVVHELADEQERQRGRLEDMLREPRRHKFAQVANRDLGEGGCGIWQVRPRLGLIGMFAGWWHVKLSSGCPLAGPGAEAPGEHLGSALLMGKRSRKRGPGWQATPQDAGEDPAQAATGRAAGRAAPDRAPQTRASAGRARAGAGGPAPGPRGGRSPDRRARMGEAPQAPWAPFPLTELVLLAGIVLVVLGFVSESRRGTFLAGGFGLVTLGGLELALREHFAGFRSHSGLLAAASAILACVPLYFLTGLAQELLLVAGVAVGAAAFVLLRRAFAARTGGLTFRA